MCNKWIEFLSKLKMVSNEWKYFIFGYGISIHFYAKSKSNSWNHWLHFQPHYWLAVEIVPTFREKRKDCISVAPVEFSKWALHRFRYDKHISAISHNYPKNHSLVGSLVKCWRTYVRSLSVKCPGNFLGELNSESKAENNPHVIKKLSKGYEKSAIFCVKLKWHKENVNKLENDRKILKNKKNYPNSSRTLNFG